MAILKITTGSVLEPFLRRPMTELENNHKIGRRPIFKFFRALDHALSHSIVRSDGCQSKGEEKLIRGAHPCPARPSIAVLSQ